jgi:hypothetical protein
MHKDTARPSFLAPPASASTAMLVGEIAARHGHFMSSTSCPGTQVIAFKPWHIMVVLLFRTMSGLGSSDICTALIGMFYLAG